MPPDADYDRERYVGNPVDNFVNSKNDHDKLIYIQVSYCVRPIYYQLGSVFLLMKITNGNNGQGTLTLVVVRRRWL